MSTAGVAGERETLDRIARGLRMTTVALPHLAGLAAATRVALDHRIPTMGVFASGRLVANPQFVRRLRENELVFVLAHELLHLALRTHDRAKGSDRLQFNYAHDYIINDILRTELGFAHIPANGLDMPGAREKSAEEILLEMRRNERATKTRVFEGEATSMRRMFGGGEAHDGAGDVLGAKMEREMFPDDASAQDAHAERMKELAAKALGLAAAMGRLRGLRGTDPGATRQVVSTLRDVYRPPWELALQRWLESVAPGERTFARAARRTAPQVDVVLPGRRREGWILNVVLDTSGSMATEIPRALGAIALFCDAVAVDQVRLLQCDAAVTSDETLAPPELAEREIAGYGGSDLSPAMRRLADDSAVRAAVVITDGDIAYPPEPMPYNVLWVLPARDAARFNPPYGRVVAMDAH
ncbi:MAG TPA: VWA-like domain-containing protein [Burkholderiales bacterium]|nr:VWA-like domain-containing protein [Burkholderiales bacterium]